MLIPIRVKGNKLPLFFVPGAPGNLGWLVELTTLLGKDYPIFGLEPLGLKNWNNRLKSIEEIASYYLKAISQANVKGPICLVGYSFGGTVAYEMVQQLIADGATISHFILLDAYAPWSKTIKSLQLPEFFPWLLMGNMLGSFWKLSKFLCPTDYLQLPKENYTEHTATHLLAYAKTLLPLTEIVKLVGNSVALLQQADELIKAYKPKPLKEKVNVTLMQANKGFISAENKFSLTTPLQIEYEYMHGWNTLIDTEITVLDLPCDHFEIVTMPHLNTVANLLKTQIIESKKTNYE